MNKNSKNKLADFIVKSNALVEARYRLSLQESQVVFWLLTQICPDDIDFKPHKLEIAEFARFAGVQAGNRYNELQEITEKLMRRVLKIHDIEKQELLQVSWLSSAHYKSKQGYVLLEFSPKLKPYLLQLKNQFTKISIIDTLKLKSIYAIRILELLLQYLSIGSRTISVEELRAYCGIEKDEYTNYFDLKRYVIERAKNEISNKTEYKIEYREIKESRKIISLEWKIKKKNLENEKEKKQIKSLKDELNFRSILIRDLMDYGYSKSQASKLVKENEEIVIKNALSAVSIQIKKNQVKNPKAMLRVAIKDKWHSEYSEIHKADKKGDELKQNYLVDEDENRDDTTDETFKDFLDCIPKLKKF